MWVKICGLTSLEDSRVAVDAGADAVGFVFAPSRRRISASLASDIVRQLPPELPKIGVFADQTPEEVAGIFATAGLTGIQLHGEEGLGYIAELKTELAGATAQIIKALSYRSDLVESMRRFAAIGTVDALLVDSGAGGSGKAFAWAQAKEIFDSAAASRLILAGGLTADNVVDAITILSPWGVDVSSGVEAEPGRKDHAKVREFIESARRREAQSSRRFRGCSRIKREFRK